MSQKYIASSKEKRSSQSSVKSISLDTLEITSDYEQNKSQKIFKSRQNSKAATKAINGKLLYLDSRIHKDYQRAWYCNEYLFQDGQKVIANYCRKRSCLVCNRIYAARLFKAYHKPLLELPDLHLVTLTAPNVKEDDLSDEIHNLYKAYVKIKDNIRKNYKIKLKGFRKLEIAFNHYMSTFNPHYHILVSTYEAAKLIRDLWLDQFQDANIRGQDIRKIDMITEIDSKKALLEVFKYVTKTTIKNTFDAKAMDAMYNAIKGTRVYQGIGIKKTQDTKIEKYESNYITHRSERIEVWKWCNDRMDWYTSDNESFNDGPIDQKVMELINVVVNSKTILNRTDERQEQRTDAEIFKDIRQKIRKERGGNIAYFDD